MATSNRTRRLEPWQTKLIAVLLGTSLVAAGAILVATQPAEAQTDATLDDLQIGDVNETVDGNVTAVGLTADVGYQWDVPDASRVVVRLKAGPDRDSLETLTFRQVDDADSTGSGTYQMGGDVTTHSRLAPSTFNPDLASTESTSVVVVAEIEVRRAGGGNVTTTASDTVDVTLHDGATLSAQVGGTGNLTVSTTG